MLQLPDERHCSGAVAEHLESAPQTSLIVYREWRVFLRSVLDLIALDPESAIPSIPE